MVFFLIKTFGNVVLIRNVKASLTEQHILINFTSVRSCTVLFQNITLFKFGRIIFNLLFSLKDKKYVAALFGFNPILDKEVQGNYDTFDKHVALVLHAIWTCYKYFVKLYIRYRFLNEIGGGVTS